MSLQTDDYNITNIEYTIATSSEKGSVHSKKTNKENLFNW